MPANASRNLTELEIDLFLGNGIFMSLGTDRCLVAWGQPKKAKTPIGDRVQFYIPDFYLEEITPWITFENVVVSEKDALIQDLEKFTKQPHLGLEFNQPSSLEFKRQFELVQKAIASKEINKAVPVIFECATSSITKSMRASYIRHLLQNVQVATPYGYLTPTSGMLGASPEVLFSYDATTGELKTMALAGTRSSELEKVQSLEKDEKEIYEHALVVKGLREKLEQLGDWQVSPTYVWNLGALCHLRTDIQIEFENKPDPLKLFQEMGMRLHPTAALGVSPIHVDFRFLKKCDSTVSRGAFGAPFGVFSPHGKSIVLVAIRNMAWLESGEVRIGSGCGITEKSEFHNEWQELELKRKSVKAMLGI